MSVSNKFGGRQGQDAQLGEAHSVWAGDQACGVAHGAIKNAQSPNN